MIGTLHSEADNIPLDKFGLSKNVKKKKERTRNDRQLMAFLGLPVNEHLNKIYHLFIYDHEPQILSHLFSFLISYLFYYSKRRRLIN